MILPAFVQSGVDLTTFNTLALRCRTAYFARIRSPEQLAELAGPAAALPRFVLGGGSNVVVGSDFDGLVLHMAIGGRALVAEDNDAWYVRAGAGENWHQFVLWTLAQGWPGLENLVLIPGTVGAAPVQNIGAYGLEIAECVHSVKAFDIGSREWRSFDRETCRFAYRDSIFKQERWHLDGRLIIVEVTFRLPKHWTPRTGYGDVARELERLQIDAPQARDVAGAVETIRRSKLPDPSELPNAGSFFHNPVVPASTAERLRATHPRLPVYPQADGRVKLAAGWLIEHAGWKGRRLGTAGMYAKQALVLVNHGGATRAEVVALMRAVQDDVRVAFGVELTPEPIFL